MWQRRCSLVGMVHVMALPGAAGYCGSVQAILDRALEEALVYKKHGFDAVMLENMHDTPYLCGVVEPETTAAMAVLAQAVKVAVELPVGLQILAGASIDSLAAAVASSVDFIRVEGFVFAHVGDEGIHQSCAGKLIRRRDQLKANHIKIFADIKKKHSAHAITADVSLEETAKAAEFFKADGVIVTGEHTGKAPPAEEVARVRRSVGCGVLVGSGVDVTNLAEFVPFADALIVGSSLKQDGVWSSKLMAERVENLAARLSVSS